MGAAALAIEQSSIVDLYDKVTEDQGVLLDLIKRLLACQKVALVEQANSQIQSPHAQAIEPLLKHSNLKPFVIQGDSAFLFICDRGPVGTYLCAQYCSDEEAQCRTSLQCIIDMATHIQQAVSMSVQISKQESELDAIYYVLNHYPVPVMAVDNHKAVVFCNDSAKSALNILSDGYSRLSPADHANHRSGLLGKRDVNRTLDECLAVERSMCRYLKIDIDDVQLPIVITRAVAVPDVFHHYSRESVVWIYILSAGFTETIKSNTQFQQLGLTIAETNLALLVFEGLSLKEVAVKRNVSSQTIRKQMQSVFKKTACDGQESLILFLFEHYIQHKLI